MEEALIAALLADPALSALVGARIHWNILPQGLALPAVTLHLVSAPREYTLESRVSLVGYMIQVDCWGGTYGVAKAVSRAVIQVLDTLNDDPFQGCFVENERDDSDQLDAPPKSGGPTLIHRTGLDVRVCHVGT